MTQFAGPHWCDQFSASDSIDDLAEPFRSGVASFVDALRAAGATVKITQTYRPPERAYLMHWACLVAGYRDSEKVFHQIAPGDVPPHPGIQIDWTVGGDPGGAIAAAVAMRNSYGIVYPAAIDSRHTERLAVDMTITWQGQIMVATRSGRLLPVKELPELYPIGATYGVMKLPSDPPHWSVDGR